MYYVGEIDSAYAPCVAVNAVKDQLSIIGSDDDDLIRSLIIAAQSAIEAQTHIKLTMREVKLAFTGSGDRVSLNFSPALSISSVIADGVEITSYTFCKYGINPVILFGQNVVANELVVTANIGHLSNSAPPALLQLVKMLAADMYEHREAQAETLLNENKNYLRILGMYTYSEVR